MDDPLSRGGAPFFIFAGRVAVAGAKEPDTLAEAMAQALESAGD
jgi:predicted DsbA family dithiol-disulfide isomerase